MKRHTVFEVERQRDTLVVIPQSDSLKFQETELTRGIDKLHELMDQPQYVNLVFDLGSAPYFGSMMISAFLALGVKVRDSGGRVAWCNASKSMHDVIRIMKLDIVIPYFPSRKSALESLDAGK